jgi:hypothetical protein
MKKPQIWEKFTINNRAEKITKYRKKWKNHKENGEGGEER